LRDSKQFIRDLFFVNFFRGKSPSAEFWCGIRWQNVFPRKKVRTKNRPLWMEQGDQIGRIVAFWVIVYFGQFFVSTINVTHIFALFFPTYRLYVKLLVLTKMHWATLWTIFSQTHQGSMLWSLFSAIFPNFRRKNWRFSQKPMLWSTFCII
jgi:hypothetical protein